VRRRLGRHTSSKCRHPDLEIVVEGRGVCVLLLVFLEQGQVVSVSC